MIYPKNKYGVEGDNTLFLHLLPNGLMIRKSRADWLGRIL